MHRRWLIALVVIAVVVWLQTVSEPVVQAQNDPLPVRVGESIQAHSQFCRVQQIHGLFVRCQSDPGDKQERWLNLGSSSGFAKIVSE